jgi:uncharacterized protein (TIGR03032 family)
MSTPAALPPFATAFSPQLPELLWQLQCSIAITTYQANKMVFISPVDIEKLTQLPRSFNGPMGISVQGNKMVLGCKDEVTVFENSVDLAKHYPNKPNTYDSLWLPRQTFYTGRVDMHDIAFGQDGIYAINTSFSCLCKINGTYNFIPVWQPPFISQLASEDRCHLNGLVMINDKPKYVTALGMTDTHQGWRDNITAGGILIDIETNEVILSGLAMPHSPKMYNKELYILLSAKGELVKADIANKTYSVIKKFDGFCRGLAFHGDYAFIAFSKLRKNSSTFAKLSFSETANFAGIKIIHMPTGALVGEITYQSSVDEIYDIAVLPAMIRPNILNTSNDIYKYSLSIPGQTFWANFSDDASYS